jgi:hypothetical protein
MSESASICINKYLFTHTPRFGVSMINIRKARSTLGWVEETVSDETLEEIISFLILVAHIEMGRSSIQVAEIIDKNTSVSNDVN